MKQLSDLLWEARADAPPPRYDVDDVVVAGRRRKRRRQATWVAAAAVVVATVGVALVVPRGSAVTPALPAAPTVTPSTSYYTFSFRGFTAGNYVIADPDTLMMDRSVAEVRTAGSSDTVADLEAYLPGVQPAFKGWTRREAEPINGRKAFYLTRSSDEGLIWEYADGALAFLRPGADPLPRADLRKIAGSFRPGGGQILRTPLKVGYVPADYRLITLRSSTDGSFATFVPAAQVETILASPSRMYPPGKVEKVITIGVNKSIPGEDPAPEKLNCLVGPGRCERALTDGFRLRILGQGPAVSETEKLARAITAADPADPEKWIPADEAFPTSALLTGNR
ncbi:hypothetical protein [Actinoplanes sp. HUAS TT8]|uniref:hypothetical protein n=1 Tax=Actinoplanes sp. HUAS TT8 TaxID=3447453 RepID=UPI003F528000